MCAVADVVIIGAGPAGSAAAATTTRAGLRTILLTDGGRSCWIETVPVTIGSLFPDLGLPQAALRSVSGPWDSVSAAHSTSHVDRIAFDRLLYSAALNAGVYPCDSRAADIIRDDVDRVTGVRTVDGRMLRSRVVIDASGSRGWLRRRLALRVQSLSGPLVAWRGAARWVPEDMEEGGTRFLPRQDGWLFLARWRGCTTWTALGRHLPADVAALRSVRRPSSWNVSWRLVRTVAGRGWLLAGEAAGRLDPAWGQGLVSAVASGMAAGRTAAAMLADPQRESIYLAAYDGWFADRLHEGAASLRQRYADNGIDLPAVEQAVVA